MTRLSSLQTTEARWAANDAEQLWRDHKTHCPACSEAARHRQWGNLCGRGTILLQDKKDTARELERNRKADRLPVPGQESLL